MELRITTLIENNPAHNGQLHYEHGLSLYIEADGKKILFDTGKSGAFIDNANSLGKDLDTLNYVIISHGHYDHSGGVKKLVKERNNLPSFLVGEEFFNLKYAKEDEEYRDNGNSFDIQFMKENKISLTKIKEEVFYLTQNILVFHHYKQFTDYEKRNSKFFIKKNSMYVPDDFEDEISLGVITSKGLVVVVGCSHVGIVNILKTILERIEIPIYAVVGGTHLVHADEGRIQKTIQAFKEMNIQKVAVSHCTGEQGIHEISKELKEKFLYNNTGNIIEI